MQEPETNPPLWGDPQTKTGSFRTSPQIPRLFRMKTKINLMTSIQCGQTVPFFFSSQRVVFSLNSRVSIWRYFNFVASTKMRRCVLTLDSWVFSVFGKNLQWIISTSVFLHDRSKPRPGTDEDVSCHKSKFKRAFNKCKTYDNKV